MILRYLKVYITLLFLTLTVVLNAQKAKVKNDVNHDNRPLHFGFSLGTNFMKYQIEQSDFAADSGYFTGMNRVTPGINIHAIANLRLSKYVDFRVLPGISFGERELIFKDEQGNIMYNNGQGYQMESSYIEMPMLLKYRASRLNNFSAFLITGVNIKYDLATKKEYDAREQLIMTKSLDWYYEIGGGTDFYLEYFKFSIELKLQLGMNNVFQRTNPDGKGPDDEIKVFTDMIDQLRSQIIVISFHFE